MGQLVIHNGLESKRMILRRQHPVEFLRQGEGKQAGRRSHAALRQRNVGRCGAESDRVLVFCGRDGPLGDVRPGELCVDGLSQPDRIATLPGSAVVQSGLIQCVKEHIR